jgi:hypothetical protein
MIKCTNVQYSLPSYATPFFVAKRRILCNVTVRIANSLTNSKTSECSKCVSAVTCVIIKVSSSVGFCKQTTNNNRECERLGLFHRCRSRQTSRCVTGSEKHTAFVFNGLSKVLANKDKVTTHLYNIMIHSPNATASHCTTSEHL